ncbi:MAG: hypothetical protein LGB58_02170, partial [Sulfurovum sp.]|nr:hypothetical protein [Sulfurovum sp.]
PPPPPPPKSLLNEKNPESAHNAVKSTLVSKQNTAAPRKKGKKAVIISPDGRPHFDGRPMLGCTFLRMTEHIFVILAGVFFLQKVAKM